MPLLTGKVLMLYAGRKNRLKSGADYFAIGEGRFEAGNFRGGDSSPGQIQMTEGFHLVHRQKCTIRDGNSRQIEINQTGEGSDIGEFSGKE